MWHKHTVYEKEGGQYIAKRGIFSEKKRMFYKKVEEEHELFRYKMLASTPREVYERCNEIRFYECVFEYFWYCGSITEEDVEACVKEGRMQIVKMPLPCYGSTEP